MLISEATLRNTRSGVFSDAELKEVLKFWRSLRETLSCLGAEWHLASKAANEEVAYLERIESERKHNRE